MTELRLVFDHLVQSGEEYARLFCSRFSVGRCQFNSVSNICRRERFYHSEGATLSRSSKGVCCDRVANSFLSKIAQAVLGLLKLSPSRHLEVQQGSGSSYQLDVHPLAHPPAKAAFTHLWSSRLLFWPIQTLPSLTSVILSGWTLGGGFLRGLNEQLRDKR